jgi:2-phosphoglycerate kinase
LVTWKLLLLGGATASGKSTSGTKIARRLGVSCLSVDSLWLALKRATTPLTHPALYHFEPVDEVVAKGPEALWLLHIETANALTEPLEEFIAREIKEGHDLVVEGAWIKPALAARRTSASNGARAVFIYEPEPDQVLAAMMSRQSVAEPTKRQLWLAPMAWLYGNWLKGEAARLGLPLVAARPRETLAERVLKAAE